MADAKQPFPMEEKKNRLLSENTSALDQLLFARYFAMAVVAVACEQPPPPLKNCYVVV